MTVKKEEDFICQEEEKDRKVYHWKKNWMM